MADEPKFKVGDKVLVVGNVGFLEIIDIISTITPTGRITLERTGWKFDKYGQEIANKMWDRKTISIATAKDEVRVRMRSIRRFLSKVDWNMLGDTVVTDIYVKVKVNLEKEKK